MKSCLIIGAGRSGTSMLAGILHQAGYFLGENLYKSKPSNPKGFFEWMEITRINEEILAGYDQKPAKFQRWLSSIPPTVNVGYKNTSITERIREVIRKTPFCYKDPRFSYTLPVWRTFLPSEVVFLCIFREPNITIGSILHECRTREYLKNFEIDQYIGYAVWYNMYSHILLKHREHLKKFFFVHYKQIYDGTALPAISEFLEVDLRRDFVEKTLNRTISFDPIPGDVKEIYRQLCDLAHYPLKDPQFPNMA